ncbi:hydantoinase/oxoprolinase family protein [Archaeoglobus neptunius]|uniref:hydantoinase/oxoprolinase family protein n=1 Tax=Archaeoglobus neptunius TaxID=2798580 RepID=UPI001928AFE4|nr:hydantoinase/oxoprolinase family protein [Archaeoglobus neptunius]
MIIGIDVGGTNTDAAIVSDEIRTLKVSNEVGIGGVLKEVSKEVDLKNEKVVVSTSWPLNLIISKFSEYHTLSLVIPGPGLNYSDFGIILKGYVNHRGDVVEDIDREEIERVLQENKFDNIAISSKFSVRNGHIEDQILEIARKYADVKKIALSHYAGGMNFPARINTTVVNAKIKETVHNLTELIRSYAGDFYYFKGDGGIVPYQIVLENPSELYNSSPAAVALGARYLTKEEDALVVDIGGTSTDFVELVNGMPRIVEGIDISGRRTLIRCVDSISIPFGGDSLVEDGKLIPRHGKSFAFGGESFTLTDALNCAGNEIGNYRTSRKLECDVESVIDQYVSLAASTVESIGGDTIIGTGYLAPYLIPEIAKRARVRYIIPEHYESANAVGVAVSKISLTLYARIDTEKGFAAYNGNVEDCPFRTASLPDDEQILEKVEEKIVEIARKFGARDEELGSIKPVYFHSFTVVRGGMKRGIIADVVMQIEPGIRYD